MDYTPPARRPTPTPLLVQFRVLHALILREMQSRFGRRDIGYLWAIVEPISIVVVLSLVRTVLRTPAPSDIGFVPLIATGFLPFLMFRQTQTLIMMATKANLRLLTHPQLTPTDFMFARLLLQIPTALVIMIIAHFALVISGFVDSIQSPLFVGVGVLMAVGLGFGLGALLNPLMQIFPIVEHVAQIGLRPMVFVSGTFFLAQEIPEPYRSYLLWNPLLQINEFIRSWYFESFHSPYYNLRYIFAWILCTTVFGLLLERIVRSRVAPV